MNNESAYESEFLHFYIIYSIVQDRELGGVYLPPLDLVYGNFQSLLPLNPSRFYVLYDLIFVRSSTSLLEEILFIPS